MKEKLHSESCERNKAVILEVLQEVLSEGGLVLEVGSGTGQHAAFFGANLPQIQWQPSDVAPAAESIEAWTEEEGATNVRSAIELDLFDPWPLESADAIVCINAIHIAPWAATRRLFELGRDILPAGAPILLYGPFRYLDRELEPSNERFDLWLKERNPESGIRTFDHVDAIAKELGFNLVEDRAMPANNRCLWWRKSS